MVEGKQFESLYAENRDEAWKMAQQVFGCDWEEDAGASNGAGYPIYRGTSDARCWISDLGSRLELNMADGSTINIWLEDAKTYTAAEVKGIIINARSELKAIEKILAFVYEQECTLASVEVEGLLRRKQDEYNRQLEAFGLL